MLEFIFTLAMALRCYPLQPGGLLTLEAVAIGMTSPERVFIETASAIEVVLLLIFMVAGIYFLKELLRFMFTKILTRVRSKTRCALLFSLAAAVLVGLSRRADGDRPSCITVATGVLRRLPPRGVGQARERRRSRSVERWRGAGAARAPTSTVSARSCAASSCTRPSAPRSAA